MCSKKVTFKGSWEVLKEMVNGFSDDKGFKLSAALAYNTIFSMPPMLLLIISIASTFYNKDTIRGKVNDLIADWIGKESSQEIFDAIGKINFHKNNQAATLISIIVLIFAATGIFTDIQDSFNIIWGVRYKANKSIIKVIWIRVLSFIIIIGLGALTWVLLLTDTIITATEDFFTKHVPFIPVHLISDGNTIGLVIVLMILFSVTYTILPDVKLPYKYVWPGALFTTILFTMGKYLIGIYVSSSSMVSVYGAAGSIIILMLWIYYSAVILYLGLEFIRAYTLHKGVAISPSKYAEFDDKILVDQYELEQKTNVGNLKNIEKEK